MKDFVHKFGLMKMSSIIMIFYKRFHFNPIEFNGRAWDAPSERMSHCRQNFHSNYCGDSHTET